MLRKKKMPTLKINGHLLYISPNFQKILLYTPQNSNPRQYFQLKDEYCFSKKKVIEKLEEDTKINWITLSENFNEKEKNLVQNIIKLYGFIFIFQYLMDYVPSYLKKDEKDKKEIGFNMEILYSETNKMEVYLVFDLTLKEFLKLFEQTFQKIIKDDSYSSKFIKITIPFYLVNSKL